MNPAQVARQLAASHTGFPWAPFWGVVTAVVAGPPKSVTLKINGATATTPNVRYDSAYAPLVNDVVYGFVVSGPQGPDYTVEGKYA